MLVVFILAVTGALFTSFFCSLFEAALLSLSATQVELLAEKQPGKGGQLRAMKEDINQPITAILTLNTLAHTIGASVAGAAAVSLFGEQGLIWFSLTFTIAILLFTEILPKTIGVNFARQMGPYIVLPLRIMILLLKPLIFLAQLMTKLIPGSHAPHQFSTEELKTIASLSRKSGVIQADQEAVIANILQLGQVTTREVMTPRTVTFTVPADLSIKEAARMEDRWRRHSRVPVYDSEPDNVVGLVLSQDVLNWFYDPNTGKQAVDRDGNPKVTMESKFQLTFDYNNVYNNNNPVLPGDGDSQPAPGKTYRVDPIGIVSPSNNEFSWYCLMDIEAVQKLAKENSDYMQLDTKNYNRVMVKCENTDVVSEVKAAIDEMGYGTSSLQDALKQAEKQMQQIQYLLGAIGGVSLLVAAIGIMNTMMMSIYERTKEIGIIKVLGCRMDNIAELFLTEAAYIGFFGGAAGLGISYGLSAVINHFVGDSGFKSIIPFYLAVGAVLFSVTVAMLSGLYPAIRAMRLSPLNAIRNE